MTTTPPFLILPIRGKRGIVRARQSARQVAALLHFPVADQACIAAGAFAISCQARAAWGPFALCFQIETGQLRVFARPKQADSTANRPHNRVAEVLPGGDCVLHLVKPLPPDRVLTDVDVAWLVQQGAERKSLLFEEIARQNQEVLALLHEIHELKKQMEANPSMQPSAA